MEGNFKNWIVILGLFIIPGLLLQGYAQNEILSEEEKERMVPKDVSGTYTNQENRVSVDFPNGWSGTVSDFPNFVSGTWMTFVRVLEGDAQINPDELSGGDFAAIMLIVGEKPDDKIPEPESLTDHYPIDCRYTSIENVTIDDKTATKLETECENTDTTIKLRTYIFATSEKYVSYIYSTSPASDFENHLETFEDSVKTLSIDNHVDILYKVSIEIPEWVKNNAGWWADGSIDDNSFIQAIQFLIKEGIIQLPPTSQGFGDSNEVPGWIKNNAGWWADGSIDDDAFVLGFQFLIKEGIIYLD